MTRLSGYLGERSASARRGWREFPLRQNTGFSHLIGWPDRVRHCVENATVCCFRHSCALIRIGSFGLIRIIWPGSVKRHPQFEEQT